MHKLLAITVAFVAIRASAQTDYPQAVWSGPAAGNTFTQRASPIDTIVLHVTGSSAASAINTFQSGQGNASAHYLVTCEGAVHQILRESMAAYHTGNSTYNQRSIGIELEGIVFGTDERLIDYGHAYSLGVGGFFDWMTQAQLEALARLITNLCSRYAIPMNRAFIIGHNEVPNPTNSRSWGGANGHSDPGPWWSWVRLMQALGQNPEYTSITIISNTPITTLPLVGAPQIAATAKPGTRFVSYERHGEFYHILFAGVELFRAGQGYQQRHFDGWINARDVAVEQTLTAQVQVRGAFPAVIPVRVAASFAAAHLAYVAEWHRFVPTGESINLGGIQWREIYIHTPARYNGTTGWIPSSYLLDVLSTTMPAASPLNIRVSNSE